MASTRFSLRVGSAASLSRNTRGIAARSVPGVDIAAWRARRGLTTWCLLGLFGMCGAFWGSVSAMDDAETKTDIGHPLATTARLGTRPDTPMANLESQLVAMLHDESNPFPVRLEARRLGHRFVLDRIGHDAKRSPITPQRDHALALERAIVCLDVGRVIEASEALDDCHRLSREHPIDRGERCARLIVAAELHRCLGDLDGARRRLDNCEHLLPRDLPNGGATDIPWLRSEYLLERTRLALVMASVELALSVEPALGGAANGVHDALARAVDSQHELEQIRPAAFSASPPTTRYARWLDSESELLHARIAHYKGWRAETLARARRVIASGDPIQRACALSLVPKFIESPLYLAEAADPPSALVARQQAVEALESIRVKLSPADSTAFTRHYLDLYGDAIDALIESGDSAAARRLADIVSSGQAAAVAAVPIGTQLVEFFDAGIGLAAPSTRRIAVWIDGLTGTHAKIVGVPNSSFASILALRREPDAFFDVGRELYDALIAPIRAQLSAERLYVVPHSLARIPFDALSDGSRYLVEDFEIRYLVRRPTRALGIAKAVKRGAAVLGLLAPATEYEHIGEATRPRLEAGEDGLLDFLEGWPGRVRTIDGDGSPGLASHPDGPVVSSASAEHRVYFGPAATTTALRMHGPHSALIHFACHGEIEPRRPSQSALLLAGRGRDGRLTAASIRSLGLKATVLVTLAGCETIGAVEPRNEWTIGRPESGPIASLSNSAWGISALGRGFTAAATFDANPAFEFGLADAFIEAGAQNVLGSVWKVEDDAAHEFMKTFYEKLNRNGDISSAVRAAKLDCLAASRRKRLAQHLDGSDRPDPTDSGGRESGGFRHPRNRSSTDRGLFQWAVWVLLENGK